MEGLSSISDKIDIVKDEWGLSYLPSWDFNGMGSLQFSEGYQIKMIEEVTDFQFCATISQEELDQAVAEVEASYAGWCASDLDNDGICDVDEVSGCMDASSCNFVSEAEFDDGSCDYVSCLDECGVINGDNSSCTDACGVINGDNSTCLDECGVPNGDNSSCTDCAGIVNGTSEDLGCGCDNPAAQDWYDCDGNEIAPQIGDIYAGGIVFQINEDGTGLVADLQDLGVLYWSDAMDAAASATSQGYDDWYLPSIDELELMYNTIGIDTVEGNIGGFEYTWYWSSSESTGDGHAWCVRFDNGAGGNINLFVTPRVRVIRAF
jgi:hypothetical protein